MEVEIVKIEDMKIKYPDVMLDMKDSKLFIIFKFKGFINKIVEITKNDSEGYLNGNIYDINTWNGDNNKPNASDCDILLSFYIKLGSIHIWINGDDSDSSYYYIGESYQVDEIAIVIKHLIDYSIGSLDWIKEPGKTIVYNIHAIINKGPLKNECYYDKVLADEKCKEYNDDVGSLMYKVIAIELKG